MIKRDDLQLTLQWADARHRALLPRHWLARWLRAALDVPALITVRVVGAEEGLALNLDDRGENHATNVITFDYERAPTVSADLVLCAPVVAQEARELGIDVAAHYAHLLVHGALHAQGFDHLKRKDALVMEAREVVILAALGFANPYAQR